jgi:hypothetical protein
MTLKNWSFINEINCIICVHCVREFAHNPVSPTPFGFHIKRARAYEMQRATHNNRYNTTHNECTYIHIEPIRALLVCIIFAVCWRRRQRNAHTAVAYNEKMRHWPARALSLRRETSLQLCAPNATKIAKADGDLDARVSRCSATWSQFGKWHRGEFSWPWYLLRAENSYIVLKHVIIWLGFCDLEFRSNWNSHHRLLSDFLQIDVLI